MAQFVLTGLTQQFYVEPGDTSVRRGRDVVLHCSVVNLQGTLQWLKNGFGLGTGPLFDGYPRYRIVQQLPANGIASQQSSLYIIEANSHRHDRHDKTVFGFGGVNWIPDNSRLSWSENLKSERVQCNRPIHTGTPDTTQTGPSCRVWRGGVN